MSTRTNPYDHAFRADGCDFGRFVGIVESVIAFKMPPADKCRLIGQALAALHATESQIPHHDRQDAQCEAERLQIHARAFDIQRRQDETEKRDEK